MCPPPAAELLCLDHHTPTHPPTHTHAHTHTHTHTHTVPARPQVPDYEDRLSKFERMCVVKAFREDRTLVAAADYIADALGQRFVESVPLSMEVRGGGAAACAHAESKAWSGAPEAQAAPRLAA